MKSIPVLHVDGRSLADITGAHPLIVEARRRRVAVGFRRPLISVPPTMT